jgi:hypothetical protein
MDVFKLIEKHGIELHGDIEYFAELIRQDERERCAQICLHGTDMPVQVGALKIIKAERKRILKAILARGKK